MKSPKKPTFNPQIHVRLPPETIKKIKRVAEAERRPMGQQIRLWIDRGLAEAGAQ